MKCPRCQAQLRKADSWAGAPSTFWLQCDKCRTYVNTYKPMPHQSAVHKDVHRIIGNFGGYGTGKTTTSEQDFTKHMLITPNANVIVGANQIRQYEQSLKRMFENDIPADFVKSYSAQKQTMDLLNGARILWTPYEDPDKLRSMNASYFVILEGSEVKGEAYRQLGTRLRDLSACIYARDAKGNQIINQDGYPVIAHDWRKGIVESNPDAGWIRQEVLMRSEKINQYGISYRYQQDPENILNHVSSHVAATRVNKNLPPDFEKNLRFQNPTWWIKRYLEGSFQYAEGLVYPGALAETVEVDDFDIPRHWKRMVAFDYGISDVASFVFLAIDEKEGICYVYKVLRATNRDVAQLAAMYHRGAADIPQGGLAHPPLIDPKSGPKRGPNLRTLSDEFLDYGIAFEPGVIDVDARIYRLNMYFNSGRLKIFKTAGRELFKELRNYKFPPMELDGKPADKPVDKDNHSINALEWITMALPQDPRSVLHDVYYKGNIQRLPQGQEQLWQLSDEVEYTSRPKGGYKSWY